MRPSVLADQALQIIMTHPLVAIGVAFGAGVLSWLMTRANETA